MFSQFADGAPKKGRTLRIGLSIIVARQSRVVALPVQAQQSNPATGPIRF
jgi:hypothetical protein